MKLDIFSQRKWFFLLLAPQSIVLSTFNNPHVFILDHIFSGARCHVHLYIISDILKIGFGIFLYIVYCFISQIVDLAKI